MLLRVGLRLNVRLSKKITNDNILLQVLSMELWSKGVLVVSMLSQIVLRRTLLSGPKRLLYLVNIVG